MDPMVVIIILAIGATLVATLMGLIAMSSSGGADRELSTPLMWVRVGLQALTILLLIGAVLMRRSGS